MHISFHKIGYDVNVLKSCSTFVRLDNIKKRDNIFVVKEGKKLDFSDNTLGIN
jgi:hypothetical protein